MANILLVDDDQSMLSLLKTLLELDNHQVFTHSDPRTVIARIDSVAPDILIMDIKLKGGDGLQILKILRQHYPPDVLPIIMASGLDKHEDCLDAGANHFLLKPYNPSKLMEIISTTVAQP